MRAFRTLRVDKHNHFAGQEAETDLARFAVVLAYVFTRDGEVVPYCIASGEVQPMLLDVELALDLVPCEYVIL